ncbi:MAG: hypothetical protein A2149_02845 [Candidatus Schekmanbacteria bacterium RBG_16_38_11]|uniref:Cytochrome c7-like domain-containing protein n=1 Tax=Candidatus Schekmanbacteria bacterium RBG_16_38_11 TaxID=1817880 RepID=A0A1F7RRS1_9BACT|nr:MAG: hypothetical protein A2149_02845 [Candidatus Schekmanbacteria bacterium RBG_16_38_11]
MVERAIRLVKKLPDLSFKYWILIGIFIIIASGTSFVVLEQYTTSQRQFCMTCHYKQAHSEFWRSSKIHPESVKCPQCHAKPDEFIPRGYSAHGDMVNTNCIRCHKNTITTNEQKGFKTNPLNIKIPHKFHIEEVGARCTDCHSNIAHEKQSPATNRPKMLFCFECHEEQDTKESCLKCHYDWEA